MITDFDCFTKNSTASHEMSKIIFFQNYCFDRKDPKQSPEFNFLHGRGFPENTPQALGPPLVKMIDGTVGFLVPTFLFSYDTDGKNWKTCNNLFVHANFIISTAISGSETNLQATKRNKLQLSWIKQIIIQ